MTITRKPGTEGRKRTVVRDAATGRFVASREAARRPKTTVSETFRLPAAKPAAKKPAAKSAAKSAARPAAKPAAKKPAAKGAARPAAKPAAKKSAAKRTPR